MRKQQRQRPFDRRNVSGVCRRKFDELWKSIGGEIESVRRTGERRYHHPELRHPVLVGRGAEVPRDLTIFLRRAVV